MLIYTTRGEIDDSLLVKEEGGHENDNEIVKWTEYKLDGVLVRRDVDMRLKQGVFADADASIL